MPMDGETGSQHRRPAISLPPGAVDGGHESVVGQASAATQGSPTAEVDSSMKSNYMNQSIEYGSRTIVVPTATHSFAFPEVAYYKLGASKAKNIVEHKLIPKVYTSRQVTCRVMHCDALELPSVLALDDENSFAAAWIDVDFWPETREDVSDFYTFYNAFNTFYYAFNAHH
jgi:hypothetical protein